MNFVEKTLSYNLRSFSTGFLNQLTPVLIDLSTTIVDMPPLRRRKSIIYYKVKFTLIIADSLGWIELNLMVIFSYFITISPEPRPPWLHFNSSFK